MKEELIEELRKGWKAARIADVILDEMDKLNLRKGTGTHEDPKRPNWGEMIEWIKKAL